MKQKGDGNLSKLISKKELLERYNISYGTLYRWKRMGLIPDDWLVKKSTYTGQETFFDEDQICERVEAIISRKDSVSLESIARELLHQSKEEIRLKIFSRYGNKEFVWGDIEDITVGIDNAEESIFEKVKVIVLKNESDEGKSDKVKFIILKTESEEKDHE